MKIRKIYPILIALVLAFSSVTAMAAENDDSKAQGVKESIEEIEDAVVINNEESIANGQYQNLINSICKDGKYPSYYAGAYLDENSNLVVMLTEDGKGAEEDV